MRQETIHNRNSKKWPPARPTRFGRTSLLLWWAFTAPFLTINNVSGFEVGLNPLMYSSKRFVQRHPYSYSPNRHDRSTWRSRFGSNSKSCTVQYMAASTKNPNLDSNDPFQVLGIDPTSDVKEIKRAYKRMALQYHPDVSKDDKKVASDRFAKINWAYQVLSGKEKTSTASSSSSSGTSTPSSWTPPHRRTGATAASSRTSSSSQSSDYKSTDWRDYMPKYEDDEVYDAGGDSFGAIFRDLVTGAAATAAGVGSRSGGIFRDFVEFLEQNVDGYGTSDGDAELRILLQTGNIADIGDEMDTTELVVQQLSEKKRNLEQELIMVSAEAKSAVKYMEKLELDERVAELEARKRVVDGYIQKARKRLLALQTRYKQMIVDGNNDPVAGGRDPFRSSTTRRDPVSSSTSPSSSYSSTSRSSESTRPRHVNPEDAWKDDSFGSFGRGRGSSSRRRQQRTSSQSAREATSTARPPPNSPNFSESNTRPSASSSATGTTSYGTRTMSSTSNTSDLPPHRRPSAAQQIDDKRRLRDLKVDEEFDKLKKELGL